MSADSTNALSRDAGHKPPKTVWRKIKSKLSSITGIRRSPSPSNNYKHSTPPNNSDGGKTVEIAGAKQSDARFGAGIHAHNNSIGSSTSSTFPQRRKVRSVGELNDAPLVAQVEKLRAQELASSDALGRRRGTTNPKGFILCRICEAVIPADIMNEHTKQCIRLKHSENAEEGVDSALLSLERSLANRVDSQDGKYSKRLKRKKQCDGLKALISVVIEVRRADWDDVASPGLLRGLLTSTESAKDFVEDDDRMFPVFCERVKEYISKKMELIREIQRRKFEVDQSIIQATAIPKVSPSEKRNVQEKDLEPINRESSRDMKASNSNNQHANGITLENGSEKNKDQRFMGSAMNGSGGATTPKLRANRSRKKNAPHARLRRGRSVGADDYDAETVAILSKYKRSPPRKVSMTDFQVIKPISKGAFGKVYLCRRHKFPDDLYAVKVLPKAEMKNKTDLKQVTRERRIMAKLHSPFVVDLMFSFQSEQNLFLVMEYVPGGDLFSLLQNLGALAEDPARFYIAEILHAINYLHNHGILHRDLKPDNVLIGKDGHIKLTDFGLSERGMLQRKKEIMKPSFRGISGSIRSFADVVRGAGTKALCAMEGMLSSALAQPAPKSEIDIKNGLVAGNSSSGASRPRTSMSMVNYQRATSLQAPSVKSGSLHVHRSRSQSTYSSQVRQLSAGNSTLVRLDEIPETMAENEDSILKHPADFPPLRAKSQESDSSAREPQSSSYTDATTLQRLRIVQDSSLEQEDIAMKRPGSAVLSSSQLPSSADDERDSWNVSNSLEDGRASIRSLTGRDSIWGRESVNTFNSNDSSDPTAEDLKGWQHDQSNATAGGTPDYLAPELLSKEMTHGPPVDLWAIGILLYEFLLGIPPFNAPTAHEIFDNIRSRDIYWPEGDSLATSEEENDENLISSQARDLIDKLLNMDPEKRLTAKETMKHPFFDGLDFATLRTNQEPPFIPELEDEFDTSYFDSRELHDLSLFLDEGEDQKSSILEHVDNFAPSTVALTSPAIGPKNGQLDEAKELDDLILGSKNLMTPTGLKSRSNPADKSPSIIHVHLPPTQQQSQSARNLFQRDGSQITGTSSVTNSPRITRIGGRKEHSTSRRSSKTTDDISDYRSASGMELERLLLLEKQRSDSIDSKKSTSNQSLVDTGVRSPASTSLMKSPVASSHGSQQSGLEHNELNSGSRSSSPLPSNIGMAARKFLARPSSTSSIEMELEIDASPTASSNSSSATATPLSGRNIDKGKEEFDLSSFSFENLNRLSEMNLEAAARAKKDMD